ncbi:MAG TPA: hypothetical protein VH306_00950 [Gaiellaceae bacterium]|jgi:hypothetical protein
MWNRRHRWIKRFAAGLAFAAIVTPAAQAHVAGEGGGSTGGLSVYHKGYAGGPLAAYAYQLESTIVRPDDRSSRFVPQASDQTVVARPDDRASRPESQPLYAPIASRRTYESPSQPANIVVRGGPHATGTGSFGWADGAVLGGAILGMALLAAGAALATRRMKTGSLAGA